MLYLLSFSGDSFCILGSPYPEMGRPHCFMGFMAKGYKWSEKSYRSRYERRYGKDLADWLISRLLTCTGKRKLLPWVQTYNNIRQRCNNPLARRYTSYGARGIKCLVTPKDLAITFARDRAWTLVKYSIDRINPDGNYSPENIRWIEMDQNSKEKWFVHPVRKEQLEKLRISISCAIRDFNWAPTLIRAALRKLATEFGR